MNLICINDDCPGARPPTLDGCPDCGSNRDLQYTGEPGVVVHGNFTMKDAGVYGLWRFDPAVVLRIESAAYGIAESDIVHLRTDLPIEVYEEDEDWWVVPKGRQPDDEAEDDEDEDEEAEGDDDDCAGL